MTWDGRRIYLHHFGILPEYQRKGLGRKLAEDEKPDYPEVPPQAASLSHYGSAEKLHIPGTVVMVAIFFTAFVLYYFVNWKYLSEIWPLS